MATNYSRHDKSGTRYGVTSTMTAFLVVVIGFQNARGFPPLKENAPAVKIRTAEEALTCAHKALGISKMGDLPMTARRQTITEDNTPFLANQIIGHELWIVDIPKWSMKVPSLSKVKDRYLRKLTLYVMPETGVVVKIKSNWPAGVPPMAPMVSADVAEMRLRQTAETYHGSCR